MDLDDDAVFQRDALRERFSLDQRCQHRDCAQSADDVAEQHSRLPPVRSDDRNHRLLTGREIGAIVDKGAEEHRDER
jgi:hypothetical protein